MIPDMAKFSLQSRSKGEERRGRMYTWQWDEVVAGELTGEGEEAAELNVRSSGLDRKKHRKARQWWLRLQWHIAGQRQPGCFAVFCKAFFSSLLLVQVLSCSHSDHTGGAIFCSNNFLCWLCSGNSGLVFDYQKKGGEKKGSLGCIWMNLKYSGFFWLGIFCNLPLGAALGRGADSWDGAGNHTGVHVS